MSDCFLDYHQDCIDRNRRKHFHLCCQSRRKKKDLGRAIRIQYNVFLLLFFLLSFLYTLLLSHTTNMRVNEV